MFVFGDAVIRKWGLHVTKGVLLSIACLIILLVYLSIGIKNGYVHGMTADSATYLLMSDAMSLLGDNVSISYQFLLEKYPFPPFYPAFLAITGGGSDAPVASHVSTIISLLAAMAVLYLWAKSVIQSWQLRVITVLLIALLPVTLKQLMIIQSEHLFLLLLVLGMLSLSNVKSDSRYYYLAAVLFSLSSITRTVGFVALIAFAINIWPSRTRKQFLVLMTIAATPLILWSSYKYLNIDGKGYLSIFSEGMDGNVWVNLYDLLKVNFQLIWLYWVANFSGSLSGHAMIAVAIPSLFMVSGFACRVRRFEPDAVFVGLYLLIVLLWPYPAQFDRFLFLITPFMVVYGVYAIEKVILASERIKKLLSVAYLVLLCVSMLPALGGAYVKYQHGAQLGLGDFSKTSQWLFSTESESTQNDAKLIENIITSMGAISEIVPEDGCVVSTIPAYVMLHSGVRSIKPRPYSTSRQEFEDHLTQCSYVFMAAIVPSPSVGNPAMYPFDRIKKAMQVLAITYQREGSSEQAVASMLAKFPAN